MREIKFRAWNPISSAMFWSERCQNLATFFNYVGSLDLQEDFALMQYTGLHDKNGKEIYEGDVVTGCTSYENDNDAREWTINKPATVYWDEEFCAFCPFYLNARWRCNVVDIEVIGNIYENPELLKGN